MTCPWIQTRSGIAFDLLTPTPEMVRAEDIAHALSRINRFSGHTDGEPYSVAHHSMLVADLLASWGAPPEIVREGLLHDAGEAYYGDLTSPVKRALNTTLCQEPMSVRDPWEVMTERIDAAVRKALVLPEHETPIVKRADLVALAIERRDLFGGKPEPRDWKLPECAPTEAPCGRLHGASGKDISWRLWPKSLSPWQTARDRFLAFFEQLDREVFCGTEVA